MPEGQRKLQGLRRGVPQGPQCAGHSTIRKTRSSGSGRQLSSMRFREQENKYIEGIHQGHPQGLAVYGALQSLRQSSLREGVSGQGDLPSGRRYRHDGLPSVHRMPILHGRLPLRRSKLELARSASVHQDPLNPEYPTRTRGVVEKCTFLL